jgi:hypothetical protein
MYSGKPSDSVHIRSIDISPDPPVPGENLTVKVVGEAKSTVEVGLSYNHFVGNIEPQML